MIGSRIARALRRSAVVSWRDQPSQHDIEALQANIRRVGLVVRVRWSLVVALVVFSVMGAWAYAAVWPLSRLIANMTVPAVALALVCVYNAFFQFTYRRLGNLRFFNHAQLLLDATVVTILVYYSGGVYSWFWAMYLLFILEGAFILPRPWDPWLVAGASAVGYGAVMGSVYFGLVPHVPVPFVENTLQTAETYVLVRYMWGLTVLAGTAAVSSLMMGAVRRREDDLIRCAVRDGLTGLYNRAFCQRALEDEIDRASSDGRKLAVVVADVDGVTAFNRMLGLDAGDRMLAKVATAVDRAVRDAAPAARPIACRFGGEEFVAIVPGADRGEASWSAPGIAEAVRKSVEALREGDVGVTVSVGYAVHPDDGTSAGDLLVAADQALSLAQAAGGNAVRGPGSGQTDAV